MTTANITIEALEQLAADIGTEDAAARGKLLRLIAAYARIVHGRAPLEFARMPTVFADEDGHWDNSYPPAKEYKARSGPRLIEVRDCSTQDVATTSGYYHAWERRTTDQGLYVATDGTIYGCSETGTGAVGQFAAHPGDCDVDVTVEWDQRDLADVLTDELRLVEQHMRALAFPLVAAQAA